MAHAYLILSVADLWHMLILSVGELICGSFSVQSHQEASRAMLHREQLVAEDQAWKEECASCSLRIKEAHRQIRCLLARSDQIRSGGNKIGSDQIRYR